MKFRKNVWKVQMVLRFLRACVFKEKEVREGGFKFHRYKKGCLCFCRMNQAFKAHFDSWEPGHYSEEVELVKDVRTDEQRKEVINLFEKGIKRGKISEITKVDYGVVKVLVRESSLYKKS